MDPSVVTEAAQQVLKLNDNGRYTIPTEGLYPHQWLWDSCFIAIGLRHHDVGRAQQELLSLKRGQWANGMLPNIVFVKGEQHYRDREMWRSWLNPNAPDDVATTGITQPPMLAEAVVRVGEKLTKAERRSWYKKMYPTLLAYHEWLYEERDPHQEGLVLQIHPWEIGLDNTPPWMQSLHEHQLPFWVAVISSNFFKPLVKLIRRDTRYTQPGQRLSNFEAVAMYATSRRLRRKNHEIDRILDHSLFAIEDLTFNSILIRANSHLLHIAKVLDRKLSPELRESTRKTEAALESLWDEHTGQYYSRNFVTHNLIKIPSIAALMPLYSGAIKPERAKQLVKLLANAKTFGAKYPVPSVPLDSEWFKPHRYWQGPVWINTNWLIIDGLRRYGFNKEADQLTQQTLSLIEQHGFYEYFSPLDGTPAGSHNFSWSAALTIDLLS